MHCLSSIIFTEILSKSLLCLYLSYKKKIATSKALNIEFTVTNFWVLVLSHIL